MSGANALVVRWGPKQRKPERVALSETSFSRIAPGYFILVSSANAVRTCVRLPADYYPVAANLAPAMLEELEFVLRLQ
jgi:hypothetical protein